VYDEVLVAQADEEGAEPRAGYLRHYLGQIKVPISSVYRSQTVDGTFELQVPPVLLGYTASAATAPLLSVYICLSPNIMLPKVINEEVRVCVWCVALVTWGCDELFCRAPWVA